jgi:hypothetical protein
MVPLVPGTVPGTVVMCGAALPMGERHGTMTCAAHPYVPQPGTDASPENGIEVQATYRRATRIDQSHRVISAGAIRGAIFASQARGIARNATGHVPGAHQHFSAARREARRPFRLASTLPRAVWAAPSTKGTAHDR